MIAIGTYFWSPDPGSKFAAPYTADDVRVLKRMIERLLSLPHEFVVITDRPEAFSDDLAIRAIPLDRSTHVPNTCFARLMTFHPQGRELFGADTFLQIDLDTLIVGTIDHLVTRPENLALWRNPARIPWAAADAPGTKAMAELVDGCFLHRINQNRCYYNTSILLHRLGTLPWVWEGFDPGHPPAKDDQWYLSDLFGEGCAFFDGARDGVYRIAREDTPGSGVDGALPENACIVTFPGSCGKWSESSIRAKNPWINEYLSA